MLCIWHSQYRGFPLSLVIVHWIIFIYIYTRVYTFCFHYEPWCFLRQYTFYPWNIYQSRISDELQLFVASFLSFLFFTAFYIQHNKWKCCQSDTAVDHTPTTMGTHITFKTVLVRSPCINTQFITPTPSHPVFKIVTTIPQFTCTSLSQIPPWGFKVGAMSDQNFL